MGHLRILITGAGGFVGSYLAEAIPQLYGESAELLLTGLSAPPQRRWAFSQLDVTSPESIERNLLEYRPTHIVHLAGIASPTAVAADPRTGWRIHLGGTLKLAHAVLRHSPDTVIVVASSGLVYGATARRGIALTEDDLLAPLDEYSASKAAADLAIGAMAEQGLRCVRLRLFNHIGPRQPKTFVLSAFAYQIARIRLGLDAPIIRVGNISVQRDFLDVRDVARAYALTLERNMAPGLILNIASGRLYRVGDLLERLIELSGLKIQVDEDPSLLRRNDLPVLLGDATRARAELGWRPEHDCFDTIEEVLSFWTNVLSQNPAQ